ncbi:uncharacterized protein BXIN_0337 [Babesia sp. Xinjiang]|uniref:uncharacterized protein n=1 Tax=Babesia sp. Xinjiang TaxID=462227 RepID=UPI000A237799|nr:uncharacterized protein BXIN_0337 [Babesia sp. Xinjiang]ORM41131.1 hypothetical protein BXIN_0337 [Babesia sp. Xinjiang]
MDDEQQVADVCTPGGVSPNSVTRMNRIQNRDIPDAELSEYSTEAPQHHADQDEELPEGWVRHRNGLMLDVPITPRMCGGENTQKQPHFVFTQESDRRTTKQLQKTLLQIDRSAVRMMKEEQSVRIRATKPHEEPQEYQHRQNTIPRETPTRCTRLAPDCDQNISHRWLRNRHNQPTIVTPAPQDDALNRKIILMKKQHERDIIAAKRQVLEHVDALVKKYRQLAIDAVKIAREEQRKTETERRNAYEACARYEADLMANVRSAISNLKLSTQAEQERILAERDALQRRCADLTPKKKTRKLTLDHITAKIVAQFKANQKFSIDIVDDAIDMVAEEFSGFKTATAELVVEKFAAQGCSLSKEDAFSLVEHIVDSPGS